MALPVTSGLFAHYDASLLGLANGADVTNWPDQSPNGRDLDQSNSAFPSFETNSLNGLGGVVFNDIETIKDNGFTVPGVKTVFMVVENPPNDGSAIYMAAQQWMHYAKWSVADEFRFGISASLAGFHLAFTESGIAAEAGLWTYIQDDGSNASFLRYNEVQKANGTITDASLYTSAQITFGDSAETATPAFKMYEYALYDAVLDSGDVDLVEDYLHAKWFEAPIDPISGTGASTLDDITSTGTGVFTGTGPAPSGGRRVIRSPRYGITRQANRG